jgi:hypothetical protein
VRDLIVAGIEIPTAGGDEAQASIFDLKPSSIQPHQTVAIGMGNARFFET